MRRSALVVTAALLVAGLGGYGAYEISKPDPMDEMVTCSYCNWTGTLREANDQDGYQEFNGYYCPHCGNYLAEWK